MSLFEIWNNAAIVPTSRQYGLRRGASHALPMFVVRGSRQPRSGRARGRGKRRRAPRRPERPASPEWERRWGRRRHGVRGSRVLHSARRRGGDSRRPAPRGFASRRGRARNPSQRQRRRPRRGAFRFGLRCPARSRGRRCRGRRGDGSRWRPRGRRYRRLRSARHFVRVVPRDPQCHAGEPERHVRHQSGWDVSDRSLRHGLRGRRLDARSIDERRHLQSRHGDGASRCVGLVRIHAQRRPHRARHADRRQSTFVRRVARPRPWRTSRAPPASQSRTYGWVS